MTGLFLFNQQMYFKDLSVVILGLEWTALLKNKSIHYENCPEPSLVSFYSVEASAGGIILLRCVVRSLKWSNAWWFCPE